MNLGIGDDTEHSESDWSAGSELGRVLDGYLAAIESGEPVDPEALAAAHPRIAGRLRACIPILHMSAQIAGAEIVLDAAAGVRLGDFVLMKMIGRGGMGMVFEARQLSLNRQVALKALPLAAALDHRQLLRFQIEARAAAQLHHTNIVPIFSIGFERGVHFYAMQLIEGQTLSAMIRELREAPEPVAGRHRRVAELGLQAAEALEHAHRQGIIHRDVKPSNLMVDVRNNLWITDFGLAWMDGDGSMTAQGDVLGTLKYMSPEQSSGDKSLVDHRTDVYSLGATLYELATLRPVHPGRDRDELRQHLALGEPQRLRSWDRSIPRDLETIILRALNRDRDHRYATAGEMAEDLRRFLDHRPILARRLSLLRRAERWIRRHKALSASLAFALLLAVAGGLVVASLAARNSDLDRIHRQFHRSRRHDLYVDDVARAGWYVHLNRLNDAVEILSRYIPAPGEEDERSFAWHYLWRQCRIRPERFKGHAGAVYHVEYSPDGRILVTAGQDGTIRTWDAATGKPLRIFRGHEGDVDSAAYSPDGKTLASCGDDGTVRLWNAADENQPSVVLGRHDKESVSIAFSLDGRTLYSGDDLGQIRSWDVIERRLLRSTPPLKSRIEGMRLAPDGRSLVIAGSSSGMRTLDAQTLEWKERLPGFLAVYSAAVSRDGKIVAGAEDGGRVRIRIESEGGPVEKVLSVQPSARVCGLAFSRDDRALAACGPGGVIHLWDVESGTLLRSFRSNSGGIWDAAFSLDGRKLAACRTDGGVEVWDADDHQDCQTALLPFPIDVDMSPALTPHAFTAAYVQDRGSLQIKTWNFAAKSMREGPRYEAHVVHKGAFSPDGARMAVHLPVPPWTQVFSTRADHVFPTLVSMWGFGSGADAFGSFKTPVFSNDGGRMAVSVWPSRICAYEVPSGNLLGVERDYDVFAFSPNGLLVALVNSGELCVWDPRAWESRKYPGGGLGHPGSIVFTPDARKVLAAFPATRSVALWDLDVQGKPSVILQQEGPNALAVSPDGRTLAVGSQGGDVILLDLASHQPMLTLHASLDPPHQLQFSSDGTTLLAVYYPDSKSPPYVKAWTIAPSADPWLGSSDFSGR